MSKPFVVVFVLMCLVVLCVRADAEGEKDLPISQAGVVSQATFPDVSANHWAYDAVQNLKEQGVFQGYPDGKFRGNDYVTRYELALVLSRVVDSLKATLESSQTQLNLKERPSIDHSPSSTDGTSVQERLMLGGFISKDSPLLAEPEKCATTEDVTSSIAHVAKRLIELKVPTSEDLVVGYEEPTVKEE